MFSHNIDNLFMGNTIVKYDVCYTQHCTLMNGDSVIFERKHSVSFLSQMMIMMMTMMMMVIIIVLLKICTNCFNK